MVDDSEKENARWERNMLALHYALRVNKLLDLSFAAMHIPVPDICRCGWYLDEDGNKVISLDGGTIVFNVPNDFNTGTLERIKPNRDKKSEEDVWIYISENCGITPA